ncbi:hypothetical protein J0H58_30460 [bacterium]|nr:hypothetical protein [bacterium]
MVRGAVGAALSPTRLFNRPPVVRILPIRSRRHAYRTTPGALGRSLAYAHVLAYKFALVLALVGGGLDGGFVLVESAKGVVGWAEEDLASPQPRLAAGHDATTTHDRPAEPRAHARPVGPVAHVGHSLPNGLRAPLRC